MTPYQRILLALLLFTASRCGTALSQSRALTLDSCVEYALQHSAQIQLSRAAATEATANYREAIGRLLPDLNASASAYLNFGRGIDPKTNVYTNTSSFSNSYSLGASLLLFDGLGSIYRLRGAREAQQIGEEERLRTAQGVRMATIEAYYNLLYCKELKRLAKDNLSNSTRLAEQTTRMYELGMKASTDVAEARASMASDRQALGARTKQYAIALLQLKAVMNYPLEEPLHVNDSLAYGEVVPTPLTAEAVFTAAYSRLPDARIAEHRLENSRFEYRGSLGAYSPKIHLVAGFGSSYSTFINDRPHETFWQQLRNRRGAYLGATLSLTLFSRLQNSAGVQRAKARYLTQQVNRDEEKRRLYAAVQETILEVNGAVEAYKAATEVEAHRQQAYIATLRNYQIGHASALALSTSAARYQEARAEVAHCYTMYLLHREKLAYYTY